MKKEALENINSNLFNSFNPEDELWVVGGTLSESVSGSGTVGPSGGDAVVDADLTHDSNPAPVQPKSN
jgi:hypothetical protein